MASIRKRAVISAVLLAALPVSGTAVGRGHSADAGPPAEVDEPPPPPTSVKDRILDHHRALVEIASSAGGLDSGIRLNEAGERAARYLLKAFLEAGVDSTALETFQPNRWWPEEYRVVLIGDNGARDQVLDAFPLWHCGGAQELELEVVHVGFGTSGEYRGVDVEGKAVLIDMKRILHFWPTYVFTKALETAKEEGARAVLIADTRIDAPSGNVVGSSGVIRNQKAEEADLYPLPVFSLGKSDGLLIRERLADAGARVRVTLRYSLTPTTAANVVGVLPGSAQATETIIIGGHYDSWFDGALDNLGSQAVIIALAERMAAIPRSQRRRHIIFASLFGHELGNAEMGHAAFVERHTELDGHATVFIDVDGSGSQGWEEVGDTGDIVPTGADDKGGIFASSWTLAALAHRAVYRYSRASWGSFPLNTLVADLHGPIGEAGFPHLLIISKHIYYHTPLDTLDRIDPEHTYRRYQMLAEIVDEIMASPAGELMAVDANPHRPRRGGSAAPDLSPSALPANPSPWTHGGPSELDIHVIPDHVRVLSPVIAWPGRWRTDAILTPTSFRWRFSSLLEHFRGGASNVVAGTMYVFPGTKTITMTITDSQGRVATVERQITVHAGALYWILLALVVAVFAGFCYLLYRLVRALIRRLIARRASLVVLLVWLAACFPDLDLGDGRYACDQSGLCPGGATCVDGFCEPTGTGDDAPTLLASDANFKDDVGDGGFVTVRRHPLAQPGDVQIVHVITMGSGDTISELGSSDWTAIRESFDSGAFGAGLWYRVIESGDAADWDFGVNFDDDMAFVSVVVRGARPDAPIHSDSAAIHIDPVSTLDTSLTTSADRCLLVAFFGGTPRVASDVNIDTGDEYLEVQQGGDLIHQAVYQDLAASTGSYQRTVTASVASASHLILLAIEPQ